MEYREHRKSGIKTSLLGFGCMRFPVLENGEINEPEAEKMLGLAIAKGVNYIDTAWTYHAGKSEPFLGRVLKKYDRSSYYLATKLPCWEVKSLGDAERIFARQLERLDTEYIDFYLLHALDADSFSEMCRLGVPEYCEKLKAQGKIRNFGFSFHDDYEVFEKIITCRDWDFCQIQLNYMDTEEQAGMKGYRLAEQLGIPLIIMETIKGGLLAKLPESAAEKLHAYDPQRSDASWALRFVGSLENVKVILSGMSDMEQVKDNLDTFTHFRPLNETEARLIEEAAAVLKSRVNNGCTGCRYCMPCPAGVDIPRNFAVWNRYGIYENKASAAWQWKNLQEENKASACVKCGKCEALCPQKLNIRADLERLCTELDTISK